MFPGHWEPSTFDNNGSGVATYSKSPLSGAGRSWAVGDGSASPGTFGSFTMDAIDYTQKLASGRFTLHMKEVTDGVVNPGFIDVVGSFRIALVP